MRARCLGLVMATTVTMACNDIAEPVSQPAGTSEAAASTANKYINLALRNESHRGVEDFFLKIEAEIPGFGGFFVEQPGKKLVAYVTDLSKAEKVRSALKSRSQGSLKFVFSNLPSSTIEVRQGDYSFSQLLEWLESIAVEAGSIPVFLDADEAHNRLTIEVLSSADKLIVEEKAEALGIPLDAVSVQIVAETPSALQNLHDYHTIPIGGIKIQAWPGGNCSLGYNVRGNSSLASPYPADSMYFVTAAHCYNIPSLTTSGVLGGLVGQPDLGLLASPGDTLGHIVYNQPWNLTGALCGGLALCAREDVMVVKYSRDRTGNFQIASPSVNTPPLFPYTGVFNVAGYIGAYVGGDVYKTGIATGRTLGTVSATCGAQTVGMGALGNLRLTCAHRSNNSALPGDSGGPVWAAGYGWGYAYGIVSAASSGVLIFTGGHFLQSEIPFLFQPMPI